MSVHERRWALMSRIYFDVSSHFAHDQIWCNLLTRAHECSRVLMSVLERSWAKIKGFAHQRLWALMSKLSFNKSDHLAYELFSSHLLMTAHERPWALMSIKISICSCALMNAHDQSYFRNERLFSSRAVSWILLKSAQERSRALMTKKIKPLMICQIS